MEIPEALRYSTDHEWASQEGELVRIGITDFAQQALGDVVYVALPTLGAQLSVNDPLGEVELTKSVSELYAPVSGSVVEVNERLGDDPSALNSDPYGAGWICVLSSKDSKEFSALLDAAGYRTLVLEEATEQPEIVQDA